jgi:hypothetical protein
MNSERTCSPCQADAGGLARKPIAVDELLFREENAQAVAEVCRTSTKGGSHFL